MIQYIQFIAEVGVGGAYGSISSWSRDKHAKTIDVQERGSYIVLGILEAKPDDKGNIQLVPTGQVRRVPITNVAYIAEVVDTDAKSKSKV